MFESYESHILKKDESLPEYGLQVIWVGNLKAMPNYVCKPRMLDDYYLLYISDGAGSFRTQGKDYALKKGDLFFLFPGVVHSYKTDENNLMKQWWIGFNGIRAKETLDCLGIHPDSPVMATGHHWMKVHELVRKSFNEASTMTKGSNLTCMGYLMQLFGELLTNNIKDVSVDEGITKADHPIERAVSYIEANYVNNITIDQVAAYSTLSKAYFSTKFKEEVGMSPKDYLTKFRLEQAKYYLENSLLSVKDISHSVGFHDPLYFTKVFTQKYRCSPTKYRRENQKYPDSSKHKGSI